MQLTTTLEKVCQPEPRSAPVEITRDGKHRKAFIMGDGRFKRRIRKYGREASLRCKRKPLDPLLTSGHSDCLNCGILWSTVLSGQQIVGSFCSHTTPIQIARIFWGSSYAIFTLLADQVLASVDRQSFGLRRQLLLQGTFQPWLRPHRWTESLSETDQGSERFL